MKNLTKLRISTVLSATLLLWTSVSWAQLDEGHTAPRGFKPVEIYQHGQRVGLAWVFPSGDPCQYTEYWYLSAQYVYPNSPGEGETIETVIRVIDGDGPAFNTPKAFFQYARSAMPSGKRILAPSYEWKTAAPITGG